MTSPLVVKMRAALAAVAEPERAPAMQAYMKSAMPYLGVPMPVARKVFKQVFADHPFDDAVAWDREVRGMFLGAEHREERYGAIALAGHRRADAWKTMDALPMYEELVVTGAWWDFVDEIAGHQLGPMLLKNGRAMRRAMQAWSRSDNLWKRRAAIICQLDLKEKTNLPLLYSCIEPALSSDEFFLRKAIGWALRQYARIDMNEVKRYVAENEARLSPLSKREALKHGDQTAEGEDQSSESA